MAIMLNGKQSYLQNSGKMAVFSKVSDIQSLVVLNHFLLLSEQFTPPPAVTIIEYIGVICLWDYFSVFLSLMIGLIGLRKSPSDYFY